MAQENTVLLTDDSQIGIKSLQNALADTPYNLLVASDGEQCLEMVKKHQPKLLFLELMLPKIHGIQVLKALKESPETRDIGVIVSTGRALLQDYQSAIENGANYYLTKPFDAATVRNLVQKFFSGQLSPAPFSAAQSQDADQPCYEPVSRVKTSYAKFWGTRGSIPVANLDYYRYGGNTSCLEIQDNEHLVIIDAGTGIRELGNTVIQKDITDIHLIIGHTHWDHILGFPFFAPVYSSNYHIHIYAARGFHKNAEELFSGMLDHDYFPVRLEEMQAKFTFHDLQGNRPLELGNLKVFYHYANHPGSTLCFKVQSKNRTIGYATDNEFLLGYHGHPEKIDANHSLLNPYKGVIDFYQGCNTLVHEAQYTPHEYQTKVGWGHSSISNAAVLVKYTQPDEWLATHHDPSHSDEFLLNKLAMHRNVLEECNINCRTHMAYDGLTLPL